MAPDHASWDLQGSHVPRGLLCSKSCACSQKLWNNTHLRSPTQGLTREVTSCVATQSSQSPEQLIALRKTAHSQHIIGKFYYFHFLYAL